jgi:beta-galactosidase
MPKTAFLLAFLAGAAILPAQRVTVSLNGTWNITDSVGAEDVPRAFPHTVPVPGLANQSKPGFADVDEFDSKEIINNRVRKGKLPQSEIIDDSPGKSRQSRNYFWYQTSFKAPARKSVAILRINKAQFGTAVWLNGKKIGEHLGCFSAGYFNLRGAIDWSGENQLVVRIGAHPAVLPPEIPAGTDFEKNRWTPGIYDGVSLMLSDNPVIESLQVAPRIGSSEIVAQTVVKNYGDKPVRFALTQRVKAWKGGAAVSQAPVQQMSLQPGEEKTWTATIPVPKATLWSPENPFLYVLETGTGGDSQATRFGMREFRFDTATRRAFLNGKPYFLRGSNITLHRFFEDPNVGGLPWNEQWVRRLLGEVPKKMNWNSFRFCIGPVPDQWLEIADEVGLLIQNEYFIWNGHPDWRGKYSRTYKPEVLIEQYKEWMRDNWNHPSVAIWDANNETYDPIFAQIIPELRKLDLSNRPWENSYNPPVGPDDPAEDHPYLFIRGTGNRGGFQMTELERMGAPQHFNPGAAHATICNEYGWLWLNRDGSPTELTGEVYEKLLGPNATPQQRLEADGYLVGGLTEFWRAHRFYAGVLHFVYLTSCYQGAYTCDHFEDVASLKLHPGFEKYVGEAFKPLGVYVNFWQPKLKAGANRRFTVMMINDDSENATGKLVLSLEREDGTEVARKERPFTLNALGQQTYEVDLEVPAAHGKCALKATAYPVGTRHKGPTVSQRKVELE